MPYPYQVGNYAAGDNYGRMGNYPYAAGGIFDFVKKAAGFVAKALVPAPIQAVASALVPSRKAPAPALQLPTRQFIDIRGPAPFGGGLGIGPMVGGGGLPPGAGFGLRGGFGRRRRMNPMNVKALRRASSRIDGFVRTSRRALKHTQYVLVRRGGRRGGSPGVITRAEAARALRK